MERNAVVTETREGPVLRVRAKPGARQDAVAGTDARGVRVEVRAAPEKGRANEAVLRVLASWLGVGRSSLELVSGSSARDKRVLVRGMTAAELRSRVGVLDV